MKVVVYGATGKQGTRLVTELTQRGHAVVGISRHPENIPASPLVTALADDLSDVATTASLLRSAAPDAIVSAYGPPPDDTDQLVGATDRLVQAIARNGGPRLLVVGGAGSLFVAPNVTVLASGHVPEQFLAIARSHEQVLENLRRSTIDWTYFSPAGILEPGERTGHFRLGKDELIVDDKGVSRVSMEDYAIAVADELEHPRHAGGQRFTIGY